MPISKNVGDGSPVSALPIARRGGHFLHPGDEFGAG